MLDFNTINGTTNTQAQQVESTSKSELTNEDFLTMFLTELKYQDPTKPMDSEKMLSTTLQMSTIESNQLMKEGIDKINENLVSQNNIVNTMVSTLDKNVIINNENVTVTQNNGRFTFEAPSDFSGLLEIIDSSSNTVKQIEINGQSGINTVAINGIPDANYTVVARLYDASGQSISFNQNEFSVKGMKKIDDGYALKLAEDFYISFDDINEIRN